MRKLKAVAGTSLTAFGAVLIAWDVSWFLSAASGAAYGLVAFWAIVFGVILGTIAGWGTAEVFYALRD